MRGKKETWTTDDQIDCLARFGSYSESYAKRKRENPAHVCDAQTRLTLLRAYRDSLPLRRNWEYVDPQLVREYLDYEIARIESTGQAFEAGVEIEDDEPEANDFHSHSLMVA